MILDLDQYVSKETIEKFKIYERLLTEWNRRTSLVQEDTLVEIEVRHILDSIQIIPIIYELSSEGTLNISEPNTFDGSHDTIHEIPISAVIDKYERLDASHDIKKSISMIDVGSGAGFPGMILAMCGFEQVRLCEANERKCIFLEEVARQTSTSVAIVNQRIEVIDGKFDIILSRAFAELNKLLEILEKNSRNESSYGLFHKGKTWKDEIKVSRKSWNYTTRIYKSITSKEGVIMSIHDLRRK